MFVWARWINDDTNGGALDSRWVKTTHADAGPFPHSCDHSSQGDSGDTNPEHTRFDAVQIVVVDISCSATVDIKHAFVNKN